MTALLEVVGVSKRFGGVHVIEDFTFHVAEGEALGIVGPNGAGKTTLLNLVAGDLRPDRGTISLDGADVTRQPAHARCRRGIGRTAQIPRPFEGLTVFENVLVGATFGSATRLLGTADDAAVEALETTGLIDKANVVAGTLTLLQRKRLELARALATKPSVLLLDEIAGGLTEAEVLELVATIRRPACDRRGNRLDRAHRPRAAPGGRSHDGGRRRTQAHRGRPSRGDGLRRGAGRLPRRRVRCR